MIHEYKTPEDPRARIVRMFGLGKFGETVADEILTDYRELIARYLEEDDLSFGAERVREFGETHAGE